MKIFRGLFLLFMFLPGSLAFAEPKLEDVFKSTQEHFDQQSDASMLLAWICAVIGLLILMVFVHRRWQQRVATPKVLNHQGKLIKELQKGINLKPAEVRQLKSLAEDQQIDNPLTLLLCPSLLVKAARENPDRVDRRLISSMVKRLG